ncbi:MAG: hypothetical protein GC181_06755 [Bacteroidetes bacterium]|nr:hypothetical protein [Bacteroidota bacterium]
MNNKELIEIWYHDMWNKWNKEVMSQILDPNITFRGSLGNEKMGYDGLSAYMDLIRNAFPDFHNQIELIITEGGKSFIKLRYSGTHEGEIFGLKPTNRKIEYYGCAVFSFNGRKISDVWVLGDVYGLLKQIE